MSKYDTIVIGGGVAGLVAGIALLERGQRAALCASGRSCLNYFSGSFDLYADGLEGVERLLAQGEEIHPYAKVGTERIVRYTQRIKDIFASAGVPLQGSAEKREYRLTPLGVLKPSWLTLQGFAAFEQLENLACKSVAIVGIEGYLDFNPEFVARPFRRRGIGCACHSVSLSDTKKSALCPIGRALAEELAGKIVAEVGDSDLVLLPAIFDMYNREAFDALVAIVGDRVRLVPTASASIAGESVQRALKCRFVALGGELFEGDRVVAVEECEGVVVEVRTVSGATLKADNFVLATGGFFGGGVVGSLERVYEPLVNLDVAAATNRADWTSEKLFSAQPFEKFGVVTDGELHPSKQGASLRNLYAVGALLAGADGVSEGSGGGIALCSALLAAEMIAKRN